MDPISPSTEATLNYIDRCIERKRAEQAASEADAVSSHETEH